MKTVIKWIGVNDIDDRVHAVEFEAGVNVVTGKSSTGKSALVEIFDYCFGSSDFTVPEGEITKYADFYFTVIQVENLHLVLARKEGTGKAFLKPETDCDILCNADNFIKSYFEDKYMYPMPQFKKELGRHFKLTITDAEENLEDRKLRKHSRKKPTPSVRSFTSFMLQHQNLVANKHAIFYRFDEKEKRDQAIEHMKIFLGFADQEYFIKSQQLNSLEVQRRSLEAQIPREKEKRKLNQKLFLNARNHYRAVSGYALDAKCLENAIEFPEEALSYLQNMKVRVVAISDEHLKLKREIERELSLRTAEYRKGQQILANIRASISYVKKYEDLTENILFPKETEIHASECPFCHSTHTSIEAHANKLTNAINWLNSELSRSEYQLNSFEEDERKAKAELEKLSLAVMESKKQVAKIDTQISELEKNKTQYELALKAKIEMENLLETFIAPTDGEKKKELSEVIRRINKIKTELSRDYNILHQMSNAEAIINQNMASLSKNLEFEKSYQPVNLQFSLETFDLWNQKDKKIYLRSMGSGANWLSCHVALFLALHRYFCQRGPNCMIPTSLFIDQPSQVYFPSFLDTDEQFFPEKLARLEGKARVRHVDEDIAAVTNLYTQLVVYCQDTLKMTGIEPQIIVTDHADNLKLNCDTDFGSLVRAKWRTRGFIDTPKSY